MRSLNRRNFYGTKKSGEKWVKLGDRNTKFFHTQPIMQRRRNRMHGLFIRNGDWCTDPSVLREETILFFKELFSSSITTAPESFQVPLIPRLSQNGMNSLIAPVTLGEVRKTVYSMKSFKASGPDGFQPLLFKHFWEVVHLNLWQLVKNAFDTGNFDASIVEILILLILKVDKPMYFKEFIPISLCNVVYKVITKVVVQRLPPYLDDLIGPLQSSFIPGRSTTDNVILA